MECSIPVTSSQQVAKFARSSKYPTGFSASLEACGTYAKEFELHYIIFRQTASHLPIKANKAQIFSWVGQFSEGNLHPNVHAKCVSHDLTRLFPN